MRRIVEITHAGITPVDAESVLDEVIGPESQEIAFLS